MRPYLSLLLLIAAGCGKPTAPPTAPPVATTPAVAGTAATAPAATGTSAPAAPKPAYVDVQPTRTFPINLAGPGSFDMSPGGGTVGAYGQGKLDGSGKIEPATYFFDLATGKRVGPAAPNNASRYIAADGTKSVYVDIDYKTDSKLFVHDIASGKRTPIGSITVKVGQEFFAATPNLSLLAIKRGSDLQFVKVADGTNAYPVAKTPAEIIGMSGTFLNGTRIITSHANGAIIIWDMTTGKQADEIKLIRKISNSAESLVVSADGRVLTLASESGIREYWDLPLKKKMTWDKANVKDHKYYTPMSGGFVFDTDANFDDRTPTGVVLPPEQWLNRCFVAIVDYRTGALRYRLIIPNQEELERNEEVVVSEDGKRLAVLILSKGIVHVYDLPGG